MDGSRISELKLSTIQQLIDLNQLKANFSLRYQVVSQPENSKFMCAVVDQQLLDNNDKITFREVTGGCSGDVKNTDGRFKNYYLVLKALQPVSVRIIIQELPDIVAPVEHATPPSQIAKDVSNMSNSSPYLFIALGIVALILIVMQLMKKKRER